MIHIEWPLRFEIWDSISSETSAI